MFSISVRVEEFLLITLMCCGGCNEGCVCTDASMKGDVRIFV